MRRPPARQRVLLHRPSLGPASTPAPAICRHHAARESLSCTPAAAGLACRYGYEDVSTSYNKVVVERQYYRVVSATFCHLNLLHLVFNMGSLYTVGALRRVHACIPRARATTASGSALAPSFEATLLAPAGLPAGVLEASLGSFFYFHRTVLLILLSEAVWMAITHLLVHTWRQPRFASSSAVGYSGVIFGWMTILQLYNPSFAIPLPLGLNLPIAVAPFVSLFITQLIVPQASFLGHLAGIIAGYPIALGWLVRRRPSPLRARSGFV